MNKTYRSIWNSKLGAWVAASELTKSRGKASSAVCGAVSAVAIAALSALVPSGAFAQSVCEPGMGTATGVNSLVCGVGASANGLNTTAIGSGAIATQQNATALGNNAHAEVEASLAVGSTATAKGFQSTAVGTSSNAIGANAAAFGTGAIATGPNSTALGTGSGAGDGSVAVGSGAHADAVGGSSLGLNANASKDSASAFGSSAKALQLQATAVGSSALADGVNAVALGVQAHAVATDALALGTSSVATDDGAVALGTGSKTAPVVTTKTGVINGTTYTYAGGSPASTVSVGTAGNERTITNVAAGRVNSTSTDAINGSQLDATNQALTKLNTGAAGVVQYSNAATPTTPNGGTATNDATLVGAAPGPVVLHNIGAGSTAAGSTDAINGDQFNKLAGDTSTTFITNNGAGVKYVRTNDTGLPAADAHAQVAGSTAVGYNAVSSAADAVALGKNATASVANSVALGANATTAATVATPNGVINGTTYTYAGGAPVGTVSVGSVNAERTITNVAAGRVNSTSTDAVNGSQLDATNQAVTKLNTGAAGVVQYSNAATPTTPNGGTATNNATLVGAAPGPVVLHNVGAGSTAAGSTDAVNGDQFNKLAGDTSTTFVTNNGAGVKYVRTNDTGLPAADAHAQVAGSTAVGYNAVSSAADALALGKNATASVANSVALGANATTDPVVATPSAVINGASYTFAGAAPVGTVSVGSLNAERTITNVAAGRISATSTDAINGSQLNATNMAVDSLAVSVATSVNNAVATSKAYTDTRISGLGDQMTIIDARVTRTEGDVKDLQDGHAGGFQVSSDRTANAAPTGKNSVAGGAGAIASGDSSMAMGNDAKAIGDKSTAIGNGARVDASAGNSVALGNSSVASRGGNPNYSAIGVGAGQSSVGEVSVGAPGAERQITNVAPGKEGTDAVNVNQLAGVAKNAGERIDSMGRELNERIDKEGKDARAGTSAAMAMAALPQAYIPGKSMVTAGVGSYRGQAALALGLTKLSENGRWVSKFAGSVDTRGKVGVAAGIGMHW